MQKWCVIISILFISIGCNNKSYIQKGPARILFFEKEFDFGTVDQEKSMTHIFNFKNAGGDTLIINKVNAPCGCTAGEVASNKIAPNEKGQIKATFHSKRYKGEVKKTIYVHSNDSTNAVFPLTLKATVVDPSQWITQ